MLGTRVDAALSDFFPIRMRRAKLQLAGNSGEAPSPFEFFAGKSTIIGLEANQVHTSLNKATGKLDHKLIPHVKELDLLDGTKQLQVTMDARDRHKVARVIQRTRVKSGLAPLSDEQLAFEENKVTIKSIDQPLIHRTFSFSFDFLRHAMMKIAYELAFKWLGEAYLDDPMASVLRAAICSPKPDSTNAIRAHVDFAGVAQSDVFGMWDQHEAHHLAYACHIYDAGNVVLSIRIFDIYVASIVVTEQPGRYFQMAEDWEKLRFIAIDSVTGKTVDTSFNVEKSRMAGAMMQFGRPPPFPDPLLELTPTSGSERTD